MLITVGFEVVCNGLNIIGVISNTLFKNNRGLGFWFNSIMKWLLLPRAINLLIMSLFFFSFMGDVCFCDGREYFFNYCQFEEQLTFNCTNQKLPLPTQEDLDNRLIQCLSFKHHDDLVKLTP